MKGKKLKEAKKITTLRKTIEEYERKVA